MWVISVARSAIRSAPRFCATPSLTVMIMVELPFLFAAGVMVTVRFAPVPPKTMLPTGTTTVLDDDAETVRDDAAVFDRRTGIIIVEAVDARKQRRDMGVRAHPEHHHVDRPGAFGERARPSVAADLKTERERRKYRRRRAGGSLQKMSPQQRDVRALIAVGHAALIRQRHMNARPR